MPTSGATEKVHFDKALFQELNPTTSFTVKPFNVLLDIFCVKLIHNFPRYFG